MASEARTGPAAARRRWLALALAFLYLGALFAAGLHRAQIEHAVCEHGELVHGEASAATPADRAGAGIDVDSAPDEHERDLHEHCSVATADRTSRAAAVSTPCALVAPRPPVRIALRAATPRTEPIARLRFAPHHSPPRA
jgi:hypothetical protein